MLCSAQHIQQHNNLEIVSVFSNFSYLGNVLLTINFFTNFFTFGMIENTLSHLHFPFLRLHPDFHCPHLPLPHLRPPHAPTNNCDQKHQKNKKNAWWQYAPTCLLFCLFHILFCLFLWLCSFFFFFFRNIIESSSEKLVFQFFPFSVEFDFLDSCAFLECHVLLVVSVQQFWKMLDGWSVSLFLTFFFTFFSDWKFEELAGPSGKREFLHEMSDGCSFFGECKK